MAGSPPLPDAMSVLDSSAEAPHCNNGYCRNPIAAPGGQKCRDCLDEDTARKRNISVENLREERARAAVKAKVLQANRLSRPPPSIGFHYCHTCKKDVADAEFDLSTDTTIKPPQRPGRRRQSAAARPTPGAKPPASSDATDQFWGAVPVGRPRTTSTAPHRTQLPSSSGLMLRLTAPVSSSTGAAAAAVVTSKHKARTASKPVLAAAPSTLSTVHFTASHAPIAAAAAVASGRSPTRTREDRQTPPSPVEPDAKRRHTHSTPSTHPRSSK